MCLGILLHHDGAGGAPTQAQVHPRGQELAAPGAIAHMRAHRAPRENSTGLGRVALTGGPVCVWERGACARGGCG